MKALFPELKLNLSIVLENGSGLVESLKFLDEIKGHPQIQADHQLKHFLERRSYKKAWDHIQNEERIDS